ncbi:hypothetical protein CL652_01875 [bacterium]|nr:hypothetical protein [bacterium]|tara:strand:- start:20374 stop:21951 length:1578 start_codon:yes stop_codon:yes gene_type:complete
MSFLSKLFGIRNTGPDWSFQVTAISAVIRDFQQNIAGRFLLVLPTGGGKTLTAIRSLNEMLNKGMISRDDKVLWIVHTLSLHTHAVKNLQKEAHYSKFSLNQELKSIVDVRMKAEAVKELAKGKKYKLIVIDEAHHAAASTYREFFDYPIGILGLTATPHRMDKLGLPFEKISYSITFRELVRRGVVLLPKFLPEVRTNINVQASSLQDETQLAKFNSRERNQLVSHTLFQEAEKHNFKKVIVFAGTNAHVERLYDVIKADNASSKNPFAHVGFIYGGNNNEKGMTNEKYLEWHQSQDSSILINCKILNEGYDDPNIDTVVMATPTNSILYYLQCIGRVVRTPEDHANAKAYVVEIVDRLPNVAYRIDNRWLFAEISDYLEPLIQDIKSPWPFRVWTTFRNLIKFKVKFGDLSASDIMALLAGKRTNLLLFNDVPNTHRGKWRLMAIPEGDMKKISMFNDLSENIDEYYNINHDFILEKNYPDIFNKEPYKNRVYRSSLMAALHRASLLKSKKERVDTLIYLSVQ